MLCVPFRTLSNTLFLSHNALPISHIKEVKRGEHFDYFTRNGVKYFELIAQPVQREIIPDLYINCWGYNETIILQNQLEAC